MGASSLGFGNTCSTPHIYEYKALTYQSFSHIPTSPKGYWAYTWVKEGFNARKQQWPEICASP